VDPLTSRISTLRPLHGELTYHVLAHLDLGADAASLFRPDLPARPWVRGLRDAYLGAPGRLAVHGLPLRSDDLDGVMRALEPGGSPLLGDEAGQVLAGRLAAALEAERVRVERRLQQTAPRAGARADEVLAFLRAPLTRLRQALWAGAGDVPRLRILDCDALLRSGGTHGRGMALPGRQVVAVALAAPREQILCQVLHEETHAVTDPRVLSSAADAHRDTRAGSEGFDLHGRLERRAVDLGQELIRAHAPQHLESYRRWRSEYGA